MWWVGGMFGWCEGVDGEVAWINATSHCCISRRGSRFNSSDFPLLNLCKDKGELKLDEMSKLYVEELEIASAASLGQWAGNAGDGDHVGKEDNTVAQEESKKRKVVA